MTDPVGADMRVRWERDERKRASRERKKERRAERKLNMTENSPELGPRLPQESVDKFAQAVLLSVDFYWASVLDPQAALQDFAAGKLAFVIGNHGMEAVAVAATAPAPPVRAPEPPVRDDGPSPYI